ncbi:MAG: hypothetical protein KAS86_05265, partial [Candidatus Omnitrophica bacterium]|nr:hypothetical protein [Candidatus Omnitrophota bacterium]
MSKTGLFIFLTWLTLVIFLAPAIDTYNFMSPAGRVTRDTPFYIRFLGEGRSILSNLSILQADLYLHGGVGHFHEDHPHGMAISDKGAEKPLHIHKGREHIDPADHEHAEKGLSEPGRFNVLLRIARAAEITEHIHLGRDEIQEVVPWLYYSAKIDPHNVLAYTLAGYWL